MPYLNLNDLNLYYRTAGTGPPLLLIMGWCGNADWWPPSFTEPLAAHFQLIMPDNRGAGRTRGDSRGFTIRKACEDIVGLLDALQIESICVIGVSMGGMITQQLALDFPHRVKKIVLACTTCGLRGGAILGKETLKLLWSYLSDRATRKRPLMINLLFTREYLETQPGFVFRALSQFAIAPIRPRAAWDQLKGILRFGSWTRLTDLRFPCLVITGNRDALLPARNSRILARRILGAKLVIIPDAGHGFFHQAAEQTVDQVLPFLAELGQPC